MNFTGRSSGNGEILTGEMNATAEDRAGAGHHAVGVKCSALHAEQSGAVFSEKPGFLKAMGIAKFIDPFPGS